MIDSPPSSLQQLNAFFRYDTLLNWRQRTIPVAYGILTIVIILIIVIVRPSDTIESSSDIQLKASTQTLFSIFPVLHVFGILLIPLLCADSFARDVFHETRETLFTLPIPPFVLVCGKLAGLAATIVLANVICMVAIGIVWWVFVSPFYIGVLLGVWALVICPTAIINSWLTVLLTAGQRARKRATLMGLGLGVFSAIVLGISVSSHVSVLSLLNPGHPLVMKYYIDVLTGDVAYLSLASGALPKALLGLAGGLSEVAALVIIVVWYYQRRKETLI